MSALPPTEGKFPLGQVVATPGALAALSHADLIAALRRHHRGDWGDLDHEDHEANEQSLRDGSRLLSAYVADTGVRFWIITEADRSSTCVLLPEEY